MNTGQGLEVLQDYAFKVGQSLVAKTQKLHFETEMMTS